MVSKLTFDTIHQLLLSDVEDISLYNNIVSECIEYLDNVEKYETNIDLVRNDINYLNFLTSEILNKTSKSNKKVSINDIKMILHESDLYKNNTPFIEDLYKSIREEKNDVESQLIFISEQNEKYNIRQNIDEFKDFMDRYENGKFKSSTDMMAKYKDIVTCSYYNDIVMNHKKKKGTSFTIEKSNLLGMFNQVSKEMSDMNVIPSGFNFLDKNVLDGGFESKRLYVYSSIPGSGKSVLLVQLMVNAAYNKRCISVSNMIKNEFHLEHKKYKEIKDTIFVYFTLENFESETLLRLMANVLNMNIRVVSRLILFINIIKKICSSFIPIPSFESVDDIIQYISEFMKLVNYNKNNMHEFLEALNKAFNFKLLTKLPELSQNLLKMVPISHNEKSLISNLFTKYTEDAITDPYNIKYDIKDINSWIYFFKLFLIFENHMVEKVAEADSYGNIVDIKAMPAYNTNINDILIYIDELKLKYPDKKIGAIYLDYLDLMKSIQKTDMYRIELGNITMDIKELSKQLNIPVITATQQNNYDNADKNPGLKSATESKKKVEHTDGYLPMSFAEKVNNELYGNELEQNKIVKKPLKFLRLYSEKMRNGETGNAMIAIHYPHMKIYETYGYDPNDIQQQNGILNYVLNGSNKKSGIQKIDMRDDSKLPKRNPLQKFTNDITGNQIQNTGTQPLQIYRSEEQIQNTKKQIKTVPPEQRKRR